jgi:hypothetical protein
LLSERRERGIDEPRVDRAEHVVPEPERLKRTRPVILHKSVRRGDEPLEDLAVAFRLQVQGDGALVGGLGQKRRPHVDAVEGLVGAGAAALIGLAGVLDLDHVGTEHGQLIGGKWTRQHVRGVDHPDAFERPLHRVLRDALGARRDEMRVVATSRNSRLDHRSTTTRVPT